MNLLEKHRLPSWFPYLMAGVLVVSALPVIFLLMIWFGSFGPVPDRDELSEIQNYRASQVYSADDVMLGTYYIQNRTEIPLGNIDPVVIDALLAIEDIRFYNHNGIDYRALARVGIRTLLLGQDAGGGSTITQQLAKNLYPRERNGWLYIVADKIREMIIARRMEHVYSKDEILAMYLNSVSFGEEIYGIDMASRRFFNKRPSELEVHEAAALTGMLRATSWYNPHRNPESARQRRNVVIRQMEKYGMISGEEADTFAEMPIETNYSRITDSEGPAAYFREHLRTEVLRILEFEPALDGEEYNLYTDGLIIHTTIDSRIQKAAEDAVATQMRSLQSRFDRQQLDSVFSTEDDPAVMWAWRQSDHYNQLREDGFTDEEIEEILHTPVSVRVFTWNGYEEQKLSPYDLHRHYLSFLNTGFFAMHPESGHVLAWVGGINHRHYKYDHVKSRRQPGSAFKPIVYAAALESGKQPCDYQRNVLTVYNEYEEWMPRNVRDEYGGRYSIQGALAQSINTISVELIMETGIQNVQHTAAQMGIQSIIPAEPSIALGTAEVSLMELTTAYTTFLNGGTPATPRMITAIYNADGELIYDFSGEEEAPGRNMLAASIRNSVQGDHTGGQALSEETAGAMVQMLAKAVNSGTGQSLRNHFGIHHALAGKTGTTQNFSDGWFVGMTPDMVFGSWVGGSTPRVRLSGNMGYASQTALPIAGYFLNNLRDQNGLEPQRSDFTAGQTETNFDLACEDFRDDRFRDRVQDFFSGRDSDEPRVVEEEDDDKSRNLFRRLRGVFSRDRN